VSLGCSRQLSNRLSNPKPEFFEFAVEDVESAFAGNRVGFHAKLGFEGSYVMSAGRDAASDGDRRSPAVREGDTPPPATMDVGEFAMLSMVGTSPAFNDCMRRIGRIAVRDASVLIEGETGSGKEMAARAIHYLGARRNRPFVPVNCGAIPDTLIEAEFFGHGRGAFTDAREARAGLVAQANGGTLFLDEIDALTAKAQVSLLRFLQDQRYRPVGRDTELKANVRVIAASNKSLSVLAENDRFRGDLLYRLNILYLHIPPLHQREGDPELLAQTFLRHYAKKYDLPPKRFAPATLQWIRLHSWPGNVRELENTVHREFLLADGEVIEFTGATDTAEAARTPALVPQKEDATLDFRSAKAKAIEDFERAYLARALRLAKGNVSAAARIAKKERRAFGKLLKKYGIGREYAH
jgi:DNA-binding NtrC family response regulator